MPHNTPLPREAVALSRREALSRAAVGFGGVALAGLLASCARRAADRAPAELNPPRRTAGRGRARHVIFLYMDGGPSQVDTFDPKPRLEVDHGKPYVPPQALTEAERLFKIGTYLRSPFKFSRHGESGTAVSQVFPELARCVDEMCFVHSMVSDYSNHATANFFLNTGSPRQGHPSVGAWVNYGLGTESENLPGYVVLESGQLPEGGMSTFGSGFLPAKYQATLLKYGPHAAANVTRQEASTELQVEKLTALRELNRATLAESSGSDPMEAVIQNYELAYRMQAAVPELLDLSGETQRTRDLYGLDQPATQAFGTQCLLARRLVERGVRFIQLPAPKLPFIRHWDQHVFLEVHLPQNALAVDRPIAALIQDLRQRGLLDETLLLWGGEFGRTPWAETVGVAAPGRNHSPYGFTMWMAGGGVRPGFHLGQTDEHGDRAVEHPVHIHDLHATLLHLLGIDHTQLTYRFGGRDYRLTDVYGNVVHEIMA